MFSRSTDSTPAPSRTRHEQLDDSITWVKDWYTPDTLNDNLNNSLPSNFKLKGWFRTNISHKNSALVRLINQDDVLDLNKWKYYNEVPILDHTSMVEDDKSNTQEETTRSELEAALSINKEEGQISGLGGIDTT